MRSLLDPFQYDYIEIHTFCTYLLRRGEKAAHLIKSILFKTKLTLDPVAGKSAGSSVKQTFSPPSRGSVKITVIEAVMEDAHDHTASLLECLTLRQCLRVIETANHTTDSLQLMTASLLEGSVMHLEEAKLLYNNLFPLLDDSVTTVALLFPHMASGFDASMLVKCCLGYDMKKVRRLKQKLGPMYNIVIGMYNGFYCIDFGIPLARKCWIKLLGLSQSVARQRKQDSLGELSQYGDGVYCFRNIHFSKLPTRTAEMLATAAANAKVWENYNSLESEREAALASLFNITTLPKSGRIEFDFVSSTVPDINSCKAMTDTTFLWVNIKFC